MLDSLGPLAEMQGTTQYPLLRMVLVTRSLIHISKYPEIRPQVASILIFLCSTLLI